MAIKVSGTTVIDDSRKIIPTAVDIGGSTGVDGQVLESTGTGLRWGTKVSSLAYNIIFGY